MTRRTPNQQATLDEQYAACHALLKAASDGSLRRRSVAPGLLDVHHGHDPLMAGYYAQSLPLLESLELRLKKALRGSGLCCQSRVAVILSHRWLTIAELGDHEQFVYWMDITFGVRVSMSEAERQILLERSGLTTSEAERPLHAPQTLPYGMIAEQPQVEPMPDPVDTTTYWMSQLAPDQRQKAWDLAQGVELPKTDLGDRLADPDTHLIGLLDTMVAQAEADQTAARRAAATDSPRLAFPFTLKGSKKGGKKNS
jgi:hypothetical protein